MKKKVLSTILAGVLALSAFAGCGSSTEESTDTSAATKEETPCLLYTSDAADE